MKAKIEAGRGPLNDNREMGKLLNTAMDRCLRKMDRSNHPRALAIGALHRAARLARRGRRKESAQMLQRAYDYAAGLGGHPEGLLLRQQAAEEMYLLGQEARAVRMIESLGDRDLARIGWSQIAEELIRQGRWTEAQRPMRLAEDPGLMTELYLALFASLHKAGKYGESEKALNQALASARKAEGAGRRAELLLLAAESCAKADNHLFCGLALEEAAEQSAAMDDGSDKWKLLLRAARGWLLVGDSERAITMAEKLLDLLDGQGTLEGMEGADRGGRQSLRESVLFMAADVLTLAGRQDCARWVLEWIPGYAGRERVLSQMAVNAADRGYCQFAEDLCDDISKPQLRLMVLASLAGAEANWGDKAKASRMLLSLLEQAGPLPPGESERIYLRAADICRRHGLPGIKPVELTERAFKLGAVWPGGLEHRIGYYAQKFAEDGDLGKAVSLAESLPDPVDRLYQLERISQFYHKNPNGAAL